VNKLDCPYCGRENTTCSDSWAVSTVFEFECCGCKGEFLVEVELVPYFYTKSILS
jgi:hypothetical protein